MKLVILIGSGAVGKMSVGQQLSKITKLKLFHNHMMIEPVIEIFGRLDGKIVERLRRVIFEEFVKTDLEGLIFTFMWAFDQPSDWQYLQNLVQIFENVGSEVFYIELISDQETRLKRNETENRLIHKQSKRNIEFSKSLILREDSKYRLVSHEGEIPFQNYLRIDNSHLSIEETAQQIKECFNL